MDWVYVPERIKQQSFDELENALPSLRHAWLLSDILSTQRNYESVEAFAERWSRISDLEQLVQDLVAYGCVEIVGS